MGERRPDADEAVIEPTPQQAAPGLLSPATLAGLVGAVVLAVGLSVFIVMRIIGPQVEQRRIQKEEIEQTGATIQEIINRMKQYSLDPTVVNLAGTNAERYLKVSVSLGYEVSGLEDTLRQELDGRRSEIQNQLITVLSAKQVQDVDSVDGREAIRREILSRINGMLVSGRVTNVYYTEFVVQ